MFCINLCVYFGAFGGVGARMRQKQVPPMDDAMYMYGIYRELPRHTRALLFCFFIFSLFFFCWFDDPILLVFDFEITAQGKTTFNWLPKEQWRAPWMLFFGFFLPYFAMHTEFINSTLI